MNKAKKMLLAGFLACMVLGTGSALTACGGTTSSGGTSTPDSSTTSTPEVWELDNATVVYTVDKDGVETANYTVKGKNGEEYTKSVATGRKVVEIDPDSVKIDGEEFEGDVIETTVGNEPKVEVLALFDDGSASWVTITDDMYQGEKPDYTKAGLYMANIKLVERLSAPVLVADGEEAITVRSMLVNETMGGMCVLWDKADVVAGTYDVSTVFWGHYTYLDGEMSQAVVNATAEQIKPIDWTAESEEGLYNFSVTDADGNSGVLQAYVLDDDSETTVTVAARNLTSMTMMGEPKVLKGSEVSAIDTSEMLVMEMLMIGTDTMGMRMVEVPEGAGYTLNTATVGRQTLTATWTEGTGDDEVEITATASVFVYEEKEEFAEMQDMSVNSYEVVESGVMDMEFYIYSGTRYTAGTSDVVEQMTEDTNWEWVALTADMIKGTAPDFTTAGVKVFTVEIGGEEYTYAVELWEKEKAVATTTNIASIALPEEITLLKDENVELYVRKNLVGEQFEITYIEPVNLSYEGYAMLKADAFDWSAVKTDTVGKYAIKVTYEGYTQEIAVNVVAEMPEEATVVAELQAEMGALYPHDCFGIILYSDNTAEIIEQNPRLGWGNTWYGTYEIDNTTDTILLWWNAYGSKQFAIATVLDNDEDSVYDYVRAYQFDEPTVTYNFVDTWDNSVEVKLYEEGIAEIWDVNNQSLMQRGVYTLKDGLLTIGDKKFYIQGTGADAKVVEVMQNQNF